MSRRRGRRHLRMPHLALDGGRVAAVRSSEARTSRELIPGETELKVWDVPTGRVITTIPNCTMPSRSPGRRLAGFAGRPMDRGGPVSGMPRRGRRSFDLRSPIPS